MNNKELDEALKFSIKLAKASGKLLLTYQKKIGNLRVDYKEMEGVFSKADLDSENLIIRKIKKKYPNHYILAEESAFAQFKSDKDAFKKFSKYQYSWIIDPLDGTSNFLNRFDYFSVCICLAIKGVPFVGVVYRPSTKELFFAIKERGATYKIGNTKVQMPKGPNKKIIRNSLLVTGFSSEKGQVSEDEFSLFKKISTNSRGVRRLGSAALDMCYVAAGFFDGFWEKSLAPWDVSASGLICDEAGVKVTDYNGKPFSPFSDNYLAARMPFYNQLKALF
jgi:myo-inositol-1(or 4)-monophosphatase